MKKITCRQMGGPCDMVIEGETSEEVMEKGRKHVAETDDPAHKEVMKGMEGMSEEDKKGWDEKFQKTWDSTPDA